MRIRFFITILTIMFLLAAGPRPSQALEKVPQGTDGKESVVWHVGDRPVRAVMALDEFALFTRPGQRLDLKETSLAEILQVDTLAVEEGDRFTRLKMPFPVNRKDLPSILATLRRTENAEAASPVFYRGTDRSPASRLIPTGNIIVRYPDSLTKGDIAAIEEIYDLERVQVFPLSDRAFLYYAGDPLDSIETADRLYKEKNVLYSYPACLRYFEKKAIPTDTLFGDQWHLKNTGQEGGTPGEDVNIVTTWDVYRGSTNEVIAVVDDGLEIHHEDLQANVLQEYCWDFVDIDNDPTASNHGTSCAGLAAARGFNGIGVVGAAPSAGLVGIRIMNAYGFIDEADEALGLTFEPDIIDIYSNSWGSTDSGAYLKILPPATEDALEAGVTTGRNGLGNIYVWAGGNGNGEPEYDNSNYDGYTNSRYTIAVASSTCDGEQADYSEEGSNILINAPSSSETADVTTTARTYLGKYTNTFTGTSASTPVVSGIVALMLQANPSLGWRDVQHILITTAEKNDPLDIDWTTNGAGYHINHKYGFGRVDATAAVTAAETWLPAEDDVVTEKTSSPHIPIPDNDPVGVSDSITISDDITVEFVDVFFTADHPYWGDLAIVLTAPSGTQSILALQHRNGRGNEYDNWRFGTVRHFGESALGTWTLAVGDLAEKDSGTFDTWKIRIYGVPEIHTITATAGAGGTISPAGSIVVGHGARQTFAIKPDDGFWIASISIDGTGIGAFSTYTFTNVTRDHTIEATFADLPPTYEIRASAGAGGNIDPSGTIPVAAESEKAFTISPDQGYHVSDVLVDGASVGAVSSYTFTDIGEDHEIQALFETDVVTFSITATAGEGGTITPSGTLTVAEGGTLSFAVAAEKGYSIADVFVDGTSAGAISTYTFESVTADHVIEATFEKKESGSGGGGGCFIGTLCGKR